MSGGAPSEVRWENPVSELLDSLVDLDIRYMGLMEAIERLIHSGQRDRISIDIGEIDGEPVFWHPVPTLFPDMIDLHVFWMLDQDGGISVVHMDFDGQR